MYPYYVVWRRTAEDTQNEPLTSICTLTKTKHLQSYTHTCSKHTLLAHTKVMTKYKMSTLCEFVVYDLNCQVKI